MTVLRGKPILYLLSINLKGTSSLISLFSITFEEKQTWFCCNLIKIAQVRFTIQFQCFVGILITVSSRFAKTNHRKNGVMVNFIIQIFNDLRLSSLLTLNIYHFQWSYFGNE